MVEVVGEWLVAEDVFVTGWADTHGVASEPDAPESRYLLFYPRAEGYGSHSSSVSNELLLIWCFECDMVAHDGL